MVELSVLFIVVSVVLILDELESVDILLTDALSACGSLPEAEEVVSHEAKLTTNMAKKMMLFIINYFNLLKG